MAVPGLRRGGGAAVFDPIHLRGTADEAASNARGGHCGAEQRHHDRSDAVCAGRKSQSPIRDDRYVNRPPLRTYFLSIAFRSVVNSIPVAISFS